jgi:hypothetical protein
LVKTMENQNENPSTTSRSRYSAALVDVMDAACDQGFIWIDGLR